jgi:hypothetical protein
MQFLLLVYSDEELLAKVPPHAFDAQMKQCLEYADEMRACGRLIDAQQLEAPGTAKTVRVRGGQTTILDGPFAETKEVLAGFNLIEAPSIDEAVRMAQDFAWPQYGCIEVRPVRDVTAVRRRVGA